MSTQQAAAITAVVAGGGLAGAAGGGAFSGTQSNETLSETETKQDTPKLKEISFTSVSTAGTSYPEKTLGNKNSSVLVDHEKPENQNWWKSTYENVFESFKEKHRSNLHLIFATVNKNYSLEDLGNVVPLNSACHKAYNLKWHEINSENHLLDNVKLFCTNPSKAKSIVEPEEEVQAPKMLLSEKTNSPALTTDKFGAKGTNKTLLVAGVGNSDKSNKDWWPYVYKKHFLPKKKEGGTGLHSHFSSVRKGYTPSEIDETTTPKESLNQACEAAYRLTTISDSNLKKNIEIFCTKGLTGSETLTY